ncbi:hypothetical protein CIPAW_08G160500 [Carya illinoinensis]|uniref:Uncharacterized protein n=1 Tax=Carya illinoinensis TaxID=32201 RepID=A0A8T1PWI6_CARIL|nr:hypothetical protein CIPAW_08G160500 [Carya illinoinensis]
MFGLQPQNDPFKATLQYKEINYPRKRVGVDITLIHKNIINNLAKFIYTNCQYLYPQKIQVQSHDAAKKSASQVYLHKLLIFIFTTNSVQVRCQKINWPSLSTEVANIYIYKKFYTSPIA